MRFIKFQNIKETNNLRDVYYRKIILGDNKEKLYEQTYNAEITLAFREAGYIDSEYKSCFK